MKNIYFAYSEYEAINQLQKFLKRRKVIQFLFPLVGSKE